MQCLAGSLHLPAASARARLKHSWLENEVLNKTEEDVLLLRRLGDWPELNRFPREAKSAEELAAQVESGFSPKQLMAQAVPLLALSSQERELVSTAVHAAYLDSFDAARAATRVRQTAQTMTIALDRFLEEWRKADDQWAAEPLSERWRGVLVAASKLRDALDELPKGVVLP